MDYRNANLAPNSPAKKWRDASSVNHARVTRKSGGIDYRQRAKERKLEAEKADHYSDIEAVV
jgi:hypothetical protein